MITYESDPDKLPNGTMMEKGGKYFLKFKGKLLEWSLAGYVDAVPVESFDKVSVFTQMQSCFMRLFDVAYIL